MEHSALPSNGTSENHIRSQQPRTQRAVPSSLGLRTRSIIYGIVAAALLTLLIAIGINRLAGIPYPLWNPRQQPVEGAEKGESAGKHNS